MTKPEPLRNKIDDDFQGSGIMGFYPDDVKSAVEFYKKYKDNPNDLYHDEKDAYTKFCTMINNIESWGKIVINKDKEYKNWLLDYCFGDVIDGKKKI